MKIVCTDTDDIENPLRGGQPVRTFAINSRLAARHEITVFTSVYPGCQREVNRSGVHYRRLGFYLPPFGMSPHLSFLAALGPAIARTPHDLVVEEFNPPIGFCGMPWWTSKPVVSIVQWFFLEAWAAKYRLPFGKWMQKVADRNRYQYFIVQSEAMARTFRQIVPSSTIRVIPPGIGSEAFLSIENKGEYALFLGRIDIHHKGIDYLIESWYRLCYQLNAKVPLFIAGEGLDRSEVERRIAEAGLGSIIRLIGRVEGDKKSKILQECKLFVMPSRFETFGIAAAEAMAAGKPVVAYNIDHLNEVVREPWAVLVPSFDTEAFARAVQDLWDRPERCLEMGQMAQNAARRFHWDGLAKEQADFYEEVQENERGK